MNISDVAADRDRLLIKSNDLGCELADACDERDAALDKVKLLRGLLKLAHGYISGVNADWPRGQDDDRDAILDKIEQAITDAPLPAAKEAP